MFWPRNSCEGIFEQAAPQMKVHLEVIKNTGATEVSQEKIQELTESAQVVIHLKTCCKVLEHGKRFRVIAKPMLGGLHHDYALVPA